MKMYSILIYGFHRRFLLQFQNIEKKSAVDETTIGCRVDQQKHQPNVFRRIIYIDFKLTSSVAHLHFACHLFYTSLRTIN